MAWRKVQTPVVLVRDIHAPELLIKQGYTAEVLRNRLHIELRKIEVNLSRDVIIDGDSRTEQAKPPSMFEPPGTQTDIQIPGVGFSFQALIRFLKEFTGHDDIMISGDIIQKEQELEMRIVINGLGKGRDIPMLSGTQDAIDDLIHNSARKVIGYINPTVALNFEIAIEEKQCRINKSCDFLETEQLIQYMLDNPPLDDDKFAELGWIRVYKARGDNQKAIEKALQASALATDDPFTYYDLGVALSLLGSPEEAIVQYQQAIAIDPQFVNAYYGWGFALSQMKGKDKQEEAIKQYRKVIELDPKNTNAYYNMAIAFSELGTQDKAITQYQKAIEIDPNYVNAYYNLGLALLQLERLDEAIAKFQKTTELDPKAADAYTNWGFALSQMKGKDKQEEAITQYQKAIEIDPNYVNAYYNLGFVLLQLGRLDEAIAKFQKTTELDPKAADAYTNWGLALARLDRQEEAIAQYQKAIEIDSNYSEAYYNWGDILWTLDKREDAVEKLKIAVELGHQQNLKSACNRIREIGKSLPAQCVQN